MSLSAFADPFAEEEERACRYCGCTEDRACVIDGQGCHWVEYDICSNPVCVAKGVAEGLLGASA